MICCQTDVVTCSVYQLFCAVECFFLFCHHLLFVVLLFCHSLLHRYNLFHISRCVLFFISVARQFVLNFVDVLYLFRFVLLQYIVVMNGVAEETSDVEEQVPVPAEAQTVSVV